MKKQWDGEYLEEAFADEIELARVHPKYRRRVSLPTVLTLVTDLYPTAAKIQSLTGHHSRTTPTFPLPRWRRGWSAAGPLIAEMGLSVRTDDEEGCVSVGNGSRRRDVTENYADHPDKDAAIWAAIVRAAIRICNEARESA